MPVADKIAELVEPLGIAPGSNNARSSGPDLSPMNRMGFPGFRFVQDGSDYFDLHHTPDDTLDKIDPCNGSECGSGWRLIATSVIGVGRQTNDRRVTDAKRRTGSQLRASLERINPRFGC